MLYELGYRLTDAASLKRKHVEVLVERWKAEDLAIGTIKNRMADLRWWAEKMGKQNVLARDNDHYGPAILIVTRHAARSCRSSSAWLIETLHS